MFMFLSFANLLKKLPCVLVSIIHIVEMHDDAFSCLVKVVFCF